MYIYEQIVILPLVTTSAFVFTSAGVALTIGSFVVAER